MSENSDTENATSNVDLSGNNSDNGDNSDNSDEIDDSDNIDDLSLDSSSCSNSDVDENCNENCNEDDMINNLLQQNLHQSLFQNLFSKISNNNFDDSDLDNNNLDSKLPDDFDLQKIISQMTSMLSGAEDFNNKINKIKIVVFTLPPKFLLKTSFKSLSCWNPP